MLDFETTVVLPVVEYLAPQNVSSYSPNTLPALLGKPLMTDQLCVKIFDLERGVMQVRLLHLRWRTLHEEDVVICVLIATVQMHERHDVDIGEIPMVKDIGWHKIEVVRVPLELCVELAVNISKVT